MTRRERAKAIVGPEKIREYVGRIDHEFLYRVDGDELVLEISEFKYEDEDSEFGLMTISEPSGGGWIEKDWQGRIWDTLDEALAFATAYLTDMEWAVEGRCEECGAPLL